MIKYSVAVFLLSLAANVLMADCERAFLGKWITDSVMAGKVPKPVNARQLDRDKLPPVDESIQNRHILFRRAFDLDDVRQAEVFITADDYYKLSVNGQFAGQGPASGVPAHTYCNQIDVTRLLRKGRNVIAVHTYYQGLVNRVWVSGDNRHGLLLDLVADGKTVVKSDESFVTAVHGAYSKLGTVGYSTQFMERYDAAANEVGFELPEFDDSHWQHAVENPFGSDYRVFLLPTPMLEEEEIAPVSVRKIGEGKFVVDFGAIYVGNIRFCATGQKGDEIAILCGQELNGDGSVRHKMRCNCDYSELFALSGRDSDKLNQFDYKSFRYMELRMPAGVKVDMQSIVLIARHLPFKLKAKLAFEDDDRLRRIWKLCVDSFHYGVQEQVQDCMDREKGYYLGDGCYTMYAYCKLTGDWSHARRFIDDFLRTRSIDRSLVTCANCSFMQEIAEYSLMLIWFADAYIRETGDVEFIRQRYSALADMMNAFRERYAREDGLLTNLDKWCLVEWPKNYQDGYDADVREGKVCTDVHNVINAWYVGSVKLMNSIAARLQIPQYADAEPLERAFCKVFWDGERQLFVDREHSTHVSLPGNTYAAFFHLEPKGEAAAFKHNFIRLVRQKGYSSISIFQFFPLFSYLRDSGENELLRELMTSPEAWLRNLNEGATRTFEGWGRDTKWNTSLFHLTIASVVVFMME